MSAEMISAVRIIGPGSYAPAMRTSRSSAGERDGEKNSDEGAKVELRFATFCCASSCPLFLLFDIAKAGPFVYIKKSKLQSIGCEDESCGFCEYLAESSSRTPTSSC